MISKSWHFQNTVMPKHLSFFFLQNCNFRVLFDLSFHHSLICTQEWRFFCVYLLFLRAARLQLFFGHFQRLLVTFLWVQEFSDVWWMEDNYCNVSYCGGQHWNFIKLGILLILLPLLWSLKLTKARQESFPTLRIICPTEKVNPKNSRQIPTLHYQWNFGFFISF